MEEKANMEKVKILIIIIIIEVLILGYHVEKSITKTPKEYNTEILFYDAHTHIEKFYLIENVINAMNSNNVTKTILFGSSVQNYNEYDLGYDPNYNIALTNAYQKYPNRFFPCISGFDPQDNRSIKFIEDLLKTEIYKCIGEVYLVHNSLQNHVTPADHENVKKMFELGTKYNVTLFLHYKRQNQEIIESLYTTMEIYQNTRVVLPHFEQENIPIETIREELERFPNLYYATAEKFDAIGNSFDFTQEYIDIFEEYPNRFILETDTNYGNFNWKGNSYKTVILLHRELLSKLSQETRERIGYKNIEELFD